METSNFLERRAAAEEYNKANRFRKRGLALIPTKFGISFTTMFLNQGAALVNVYTDGTVLVTHGGVEMGQGLHTKMAQVTAITHARQHSRQRGARLALSSQDRVARNRRSFPHRSSYNMQHSCFCLVPWSIVCSSCNSASGLAARESAIIVLKSARNRNGQGPGQLRHASTGYVVPVSHRVPSYDHPMCS